MVRGKWDGFLLSPEEIRHACRYGTRRDHHTDLRDKTRTGNKSIFGKQKCVSENQKRDETDASGNVLESKTKVDAPAVLGCAEQAFHPAVLILPRCLTWHVKKMEDYIKPEKEAGGAAWQCEVFS